MQADYRQIFQCLKGVAPVDLSNLSIFLRGYRYCLTPINCKPKAIDPNIVTMLTEARNENATSFLSFFNATDDRTTAWLASTVGQDSARILFSIRDPVSSRLYGYMGLASGDESGNTIEGDAIVRFSPHRIPGLMRCAFNTLVDWVVRDVGISQVALRVLSDNPAIRFYEKCGFRVIDERPLFEVRDKAGQLIELVESLDSCAGTRSNRTLSLMRHFAPE